MRLANLDFVPALVVSVTLHGLVAWMFFLKPKKPETRPRDWIAFEVRRQVDPAAASEIKAKHHASPRHRMMRSSLVAKPPTLSALRPRWSIPTSGDTRSERDEIEQASSWTDSGAYDAISVFSNEGVSAGQVNFIESLWHQIDRHIEENPFLSEYNHTGKVYLRFELDENGMLESRSLQARAEDRILKVIAARSLRKAVKNETGELKFPHQRMVLQARFSWSGYQACRGLRGVRGLYMSFCHYAENKRKTFSAGEKIGSYAKEIYMHGPWAYEEIQKYHREESRRKSQFDPFVDYRRDPDWDL